MITEVITFNLPQGMTHEQLIANFRQTAPKWHANPVLIRKNYLYDSINNLGGGVYLWKSMDDARRWHDDAFRQKVVEVYGSDPMIIYYETSIVVDNTTGKITDEEETSYSYGNISIIRGMGWFVRAPHAQTTPFPLFFEMLHIS